MTERGGRHRAAGPLVGRALDAAGWRLSDAAAHRDGHRIEIAVTYGMGSDTPLLRVSVMRDRPAAVLPSTAVGPLLGGLFGWLAVAATWIGYGSATRSSAPGRWPG